MKKRAALAAALASLLTAVALASMLAGAATAVTTANGNDVILPDGTVYELDSDGTYHLIPDVATANAMHLDWNGLTQVDSLDGPAGDPFPAVLSNARVTAAAPAAKVAVTPANGNDVILPDGSVYQGGSDGSYRLIPDVATGNAMHLDWNNLQQLDVLDGTGRLALPQRQRVSKCGLS